MSKNAYQSEKIAADQQVVAAAARIKNRSERNSSDLPELFVDPGVIARMNNENNQIIFGRRGTGKTHVLAALRSELRRRESAVAYIDARTFGSSSLFNDAQKPLDERCAALFRDFFAALHEQLLEHIVDYQPGNENNALELLDRLADTIMQTRSIVVDTSVTERTSRDLETRADTSVGVGLDGITGKLGATRAGHVAKERVTTRGMAPDRSVVFPSLSRPLNEILDVCGGLRLYILLDEWTSIPDDMQPLLGEFIKRTLLPLEGVTLKIAAIEYHSHFWMADGQVGLELGADLGPGVHLDEVYVWDRNEDNLAATYSKILMKHLRHELPPGYLNRKGIQKAEDLVGAVFEDDAFTELCRAGAGVVRDLLGVFSIALGELSRTIDLTDPSGAGRRLGVEHVVKAGRRWFERDKVANLGEELRQTLGELERLCLANRKCRYFLVTGKMRGDADVLALLDARVIHRAFQSFMCPDRVGTRFDVYSLDYGSYMSLAEEDDPLTSAISHLRRPFTQVLHPTTLEMTRSTTRRLRLVPSEPLHLD